MTDQSNTTNLPNEFQRLVGAWNEIEDYFDRALSLPDAVADAMVEYQCGIIDRLADMPSVIPGAKTKILSRMLRDGEIPIPAERLFRSIQRDQSLRVLVVGDCVRIVSNEWGEENKIARVDFVNQRDGYCRVRLIDNPQEITEYDLVDIEPVAA